VSEGVGRPYSYGAVLNPIKYVSFFANKATNYNAGVPSSLNILNQYLPIQAGRGIDVGTKFFFLDGKISGSFEYFETEQTNVTDGGLAETKQARINTIWQAVDPTRQTITNWTDTQNQKTHGIEFQVVGNPTDSLRLMATLSRNTTKITDRGKTVFAYLDQNYPLWLANAALPVNDPSNGNAGTTVGGLISGYTAVNGSPVSGIQTEEANDKLRIGIAETQTYLWQANFTARYQFDKVAPMLKGFAVGNTVRWRSAPVIGFATIAPTSQLLNTSRPFYGQTTWNMDSWLEYNTSFRIHGKKIGCTAQFRVRNVLGTTDTVPWTALDNGSGGAYINRRLAPTARQFALDTKFTF
jgi:hypothetical protein